VNSRFSLPDRYYGVLASHHRLREHVIPRPAAPPPPQLPLDFALSSDPAESSPRPRRIGWAKLLARVFAQGITRCRKCGGRMRVLEVVSDPDAIARILHGARAPPAPPPPGQLLLLP
jgi:hypothetical protein